jgi:hypothetical protein
MQQTGNVTFPSVKALKKVDLILIFYLNIETREWVTPNYALGRKRCLSNLLQTAFKVLIFFYS